MPIPRPAEGHSGYVVVHALTIVRTCLNEHLGYVEFSRPHCTPQDTVSWYPPVIEVAEVAV